MSDSTTMLDEAIEFWGFSRQGTLAEVENIPDDRWDFRPHPNAKSVSELVRHIVEASQMLLGEASDPDGDFMRRSPSDHVQAHGGHLAETMTPAELREALGASHEQAVGKLRAAGDAAMMEVIRRFDGEVWKRVTYVFYAATHEDYHRGQLTTYARSMGLVPALTKRIHGDSAR